MEVMVTVSSACRIVWSLLDVILIQDSLMCLEVIMLVAAKTVILELLVREAEVLRTLVCFNRKHLFPQHAKFSYFLESKRRVLGDKSVDT